MSEGNALAVVEQEPPPLLALISRLATDPTVDVDKLKSLLDMQRLIEADQAKRLYIESMNAAQKEIQPVVRTVENTQTRSLYAKLEHVDAAIRPIYLAHGFSLSYDTVAPLTAGNIRIECTCSHRGGHIEKFGREAKADTLGPKGSAVKTELHGGASTETFLKRYLACGIFNVVFKNQDDDGVAGGRNPITEAQLDEVTRRCERLNVSLDSFCRTLAVEALADLDQLSYPIACNLLNARERRQADANSPREQADGPPKDAGEVTLTASPASTSESENHDEVQTVPQRATARSVSASRARVKGDAVHDVRQRQYGEMGAPNEGNGRSSEATAIGRKAEPTRLAPEFALTQPLGKSPEYDRLLTMLRMESTRAGVDAFLKNNERDIGRLPHIEQRDLYIAADDWAE